MPFLTFVTKPSPVAGPAVVSFATSVYDKRSLILSNLKAVLTSTVLGSAYGVFGTGAIMRCLRVKSSDVKVAALSRQVTSPLAMAIQGMLVAGGDPGLAVATVVVTGVVGASVGPRILDALGVEDGKVRTPPPGARKRKIRRGPTLMLRHALLTLSTNDLSLGRSQARGLAMGVAAHGLGTATVKNEGEAFPFAALGMAAVGVISTVIVAVGKGLVLRSAGC